MRYLLLLIIPLFMIGCDDARYEQNQEEDTTTLEDNLDSQVHDTSQDSVPEMIIVKFRETFPETENEQWEVVQDTVKVAFNKRGDTAQYETEYSKKGDWLKTSNTIDAENLPSVVNNAVKKKYGDEYQLKQAEYVESQQHGQIYEVELVNSQSGNHIQLLVDKQGKILNERNI